MTEIKLNWSTFDGFAEGDHGVFFKKWDDDVYEGSIANGCARVGVLTYTDAPTRASRRSKDPPKRSRSPPARPPRGNTHFFECDADGKTHGRSLHACRLGTEYLLMEHGNIKERAVLKADGTCAYGTSKYDEEECSADFPPFTRLKAKVLPIKARPTQLTAAPLPHSPPRTPPPIAPQSVHRPCFGTRRS
jgi:hypothetical protein